MEGQEYLNYKYASIWDRSVAVLLDLSVWSMAIFLALYIFVYTSEVNFENIASNFLLLVIYFLVLYCFLRLFLQPLLISKYGASIGKYITGLKVINSNGSNLDYYNAFFREYIAKTASELLFGTGYYWITRNDKQQGWHDLISGTYVIKTAKRTWLALLLTLLLLGIQTFITVSIIESFSGNKTLINELGSLLEGKTK